MPPPLPPPHQRPMTLLIPLDDFLVTSTWDVRYRIYHYIYRIDTDLQLIATKWLAYGQTTWRGLFPRISLSILRGCTIHIAGCIRASRPILSIPFRTNRPMQTALPIIEKLDPFGAFIMYKLFREATRTTKDGLVKARQPIQILVLYLLKRSLSTGPILSEPRSFKSRRDRYQPHNVRAAP